jgi:hypothetical protein
MIARSPIWWLLFVAAAVLVGGALVPSARAAALQALGSALVCDEPLRPADIVIVPGWTQDAGALEAGDLVRSGLAPRVAVLVAHADPAMQELRRRGVLSATELWPTRLIRTLGVSAVEEIAVSVEGTDAEGPVLADWLVRHNLRTAIVVSTADHSRRLRRILDRSMRRTPVTTIVRVARFSSFEPEGWWRTRSGWRVAVVELEKLAADVMRHPLG